MYFRTTNPVNLLNPAGPTGLSFFYEPERVILQHKQLQTGLEISNGCEAIWRNGRGCFYCPEKVSSLEKVRDYRKLLIPLRCSEIISK